MIRLLIFIRTPLLNCSSSRFTPCPPCFG